jgi:hypothetical protein
VRADEVLDRVVPEERGEQDRHGRQARDPVGGRRRHAVRLQAAAHRVRQVRRQPDDAGMVTRRPDPHDGRRALVELTEHGVATLQADRRERDGWLARAIADDLDPAERATLRESVELLRRLADG